MQDTSLYDLSACVCMCWFRQFVVFVGALYALLCSPKSTLDLLEEVLCVADPSGILSASVNEKIRAILFSSVKKVWFYRYLSSWEVRLQVPASAWDLVQGIGWGDDSSEVRAVP